MQEGLHKVQACQAADYALDFTSSPAACFRGSCCGREAGIYVHFNG